MSIELKTRTSGPRTFIVECSLLGTHSRPSMPHLRPKVRGEEVTDEELDVGQERLDQLVAIGAIRPLVHYDNPVIEAALSKPFVPQAPPSPDVFPVAVKYKKAE